VEHEDRVLCASCLRRLTQTEAQRGGRLVVVVRLVQIMLGLVVGWFFFYALGRGLLLVPTAFHEGSVWEAPEPGGR
jgi:hypothetical protein